MSQTLPILENLFVLEPIMESALKFIHSKKYGLPKFASSPPLGGRHDKNSGRQWNLIHSPSRRTPYRLFIHVVFFGPLGLHLRVWSELGRSLPFRPMRALRLQWTWAFSLVCEVALKLSMGSMYCIYLSTLQKTWVNDGSLLCGADFNARIPTHKLKLYTLTEVGSAIKISNIYYYYYYTS